MKSFVRIALLSSLLFSCENPSSKLEGNVKGGAGGASSELGGALQKIEDRLKALEDSHKIGAPGPSGAQDVALTERIHRIEASLARREEALGFLEMAYGQQKRQQEEKEANDPDPNAVFAVDITPPLKAGQVEGSNSAIVTVVEAWDFA